MPFQPGNKLTYRPLAERFWEKVDKRGPAECWPWTASRYPDGYGAIAYASGKTKGAHRVSWELAHGEPPPEDREVCHHCDNPPCVNPAHLFLGTHKQNMNDRDSKGRVASGERSGAWKSGGKWARAAGAQNGAYTHPETVTRGEAHPSAKLTPESVQDIRDAAATGRSAASIARQHGVSGQSIAAILDGKTWKHVLLDESLRDRIADWRLRGPLRSDRAERRGDRSPNHKLTSEQVEFIRFRYASGSRGIGRALSREFGVSKSTISLIVLRQRWVGSSSEKGG